MFENENLAQLEDTLKNIETSISSIEKALTILSGIFYL